MAPTYRCQDLAVPDGGHGTIDVPVWLEEATDQLVTWRTLTNALVYPTCPRCGRRVGQTVRNDSAV